MSAADRLAGIELFEQLAPEDLERLGTRGHAVEFAAGQRILEHGTVGDGLYVLLEGTVRVRVPDAQGQARYETWLRSGEVFGEMSLLTGTPRNADVIVDDAGPARCFVLPRDAVEDLITERPELAAFLTRILDRRLRESSTLPKVGRYRILDLVGRGALGSLFEAYDPQSRMAVAVRMVAHEVSARTGFRERFRQTAARLPELDHKNLAEVHAVVEEFGTWFVVGELVTGRTLRHEVDDQGLLKSDDARHVLLCVARALAVAHAAGVIHGDVRAATVFRQGTGLITLTDVGLASGAGQPASIDHAAPEVLAGRPADARTDVFGLGLLAYELLAGEIPPQVEGDGRGPHLPLPDVLTKQPEIAKDLADFVAAATNPDPDQRPQTAKAVEDLLLKGVGSAATGRLYRRTLTLFFGSDHKSRVEELIQRIEEEVEDTPHVGLMTDKSK